MGYATVSAHCSESLILSFLLTALRALLGIILLSDVSFRATYRELQDFPLLQGGLTSMNTSLVLDPNFGIYATSDFWWHLPAMMSYGYPVAPVRCVGAACQSLFFSSPLSTVKFHNETTITGSDSPSATSFILKNAPGYQIEFHPMDKSTNLGLTFQNCRVFGIPIVAVQVCLRKTNDTALIAGKSVHKTTANCSMELLST
jgi:hypothetical protein